MGPSCWQVKLTCEGFGHVNLDADKLVLRVAVIEAHSWRSSLHEVVNRKVEHEVRFAVHLQPSSGDTQDIDSFIRVRNKVRFRVIAERFG